MQAAPAAAAPTILHSSEDGYLHPEVGIDQELEKLLAEDPGLYMMDKSDKVTMHVVPER